MTTFMTCNGPEAPIFDKIASTAVDIAVLLDILSYRRSGGSAGESEMIEKHLMPLAPEIDGFGNLYVQVGDDNTIAFTAHTDTVHRELIMDPEPIHQKLEFHHDGLVVGVAPKSGNCLGADDGTGIWILLNLIAEGVPGLYCFFREEEVGRQGSEWAKRYTPERFTNVQAMLSFDRAGTTDIITHQMGSRCCSEDFALALAELLDPTMGPDPTGSFTDSASFVDVIPECTNIAIGYDAQHSTFETQDLTFAAWLVNRLVSIDWNELPIVRDPDAEAFVSLTDVLTTFPEACAHILETYYRVSAEEMLADIADEWACRPEQLEEIIIREQLEQATLFDHLDDGDDT